MSTSSLCQLVFLGVFFSYLPAIGRFLIVVTFIEDALRIIMQWRDQLLYLHDYRSSKQASFFVLRSSSVRGISTRPGSWAW